MRPGGPECLTRFFRTPFDLPSVSQWTLKLHVQSILAKLAVENRTAAAIVARERGLLATPQRP